MRPAVILKGDPGWRSITGPLDRSGIFSQLMVWKSMFESCKIVGICFRQFVSVTLWTSSACVAHECVTCVHHEPTCFCPSLVKSKPWIMDASLGTQIWINSVLLLHNYWQNHHTKHKNRRYLHIFCVLYIQFQAMVDQAVFTPRSNFLNLV